jgi:transposase-like protein
LSYRDVEELLVERGVEVDQYGQVIDVLTSARRDAAAARRFFRRALSTLKVTPSEVVTDAAAVYPGVLDELIPSAWHHVERYANNPIEADHSQLKHRLRPMRGLRTDYTAQVIIAGHAFMQNLRRGHYELAVDAPPALRVAAAFTELARAI